MKKHLIAFTLLTTLVAAAQQGVIDPTTGLPKTSSQNKAIIRRVGEKTEISTDQGKTWKKTTAGPEPEAGIASAPSTSIAPPPAYMVPAGAQNVSGMGGGYSSSFQQRLNSVIAAAEPPESPVICFLPMAQKNIDEMTEDLQVLNLLLNRNLERAIGDKPFEVKLGVAMRMPMNSRSVRVSYLQDYGVNIRVTVPFPVAGAPGEKPKKSETLTEESDWDKARRAVHGGDFEPSEVSVEAPVYNEELVSALKKEMLEGLRYAKNLRHVKPDEWISLTVLGGNSSYTPRRPSVLAMRIKKSAAEKFNSAEDLEPHAQINAYLDSSAAGDNSNAYRRTARPPTAVGR